MDCVWTFYLEVTRVVDSDFIEVADNGAIMKESNKNQLCSERVILRKRREHTVSQPGKGCDLSKKKLGCPCTVAVCRCILMNVTVE